MIAYGSSSFSSGLTSLAGAGFWWGGGRKEMNFLRIWFTFIREVWGDCTASIVIWVRSCPPSWRWLFRGFWFSLSSSFSSERSLEILDFRVDMRWSTDWFRDFKWCWIWRIGFIFTADYGSNNSA